ncbi:palmitoyltransferase Pfa4p [[Candida] jaroonii]|uniref:Palmitoyltransferase Pfa4p n=1 Tax=[Candida] jaroonii TaxID=467808 RepID=A0ACA9Y1V4_9ASCO|nr:palmitoyltransferase Pfa4p [[Candida] jaroonii]
MAHLKWPLVGVIVPCLLIGSIGYGTHYNIIREKSTTVQIIYEICLSYLWICYVLAIVTPPGSPPKNFTPEEGQWKRYCHKCDNYKPPRAHHCKQCGKCVLKMDHHCPWTYNCVGHNNMIEFMKFLGMIMFMTTWCGWELGCKALDFYHDRNLPSYLINKWQLVSVIVFFPLDIFVFISIFLLWFRCVSNWIFKGMTQIEVWEWERIDSQFYTNRLWLQIRKNYQDLYGKQLPKLTSCNLPTRYYEERMEEEGEEEGEEDRLVDEQFEMDDLRDSNQDNDTYDESVVPEEFTIDDIIFPYDLGIFSNIYSWFNNPFLWLLPVKPPGTGVKFEVTEFYELDQLSLPWPPDGGNSFPPDEEVDVNSFSGQDLRNITKLRKKLDPRSRTSRNDWVNDYGENIGDFGVDIDTETYSL